MQGKQLRLRIDNAAEDVPRLLTAYGAHGRGKAREEVALALRPTAGRGLLVRVQGGEASVTRLTTSRDAPRTPQELAELTAAVDEIRALQHKLPPLGPITLRGQWRGWLVCTPEGPVVRLARKLATYGTLHLVSDPSTGSWRGHLEREGRWFTGPREVAFGDDRPLPTLQAAIRAGLTHLHDVIGEACTQRDTRRRAAFDHTYAQTRPVRPARTRTTDPVDRLRPRKARKPRKGRKKPSATQATKATQAPAPSRPRKARKPRTTAKPVTTPTPSAPAPSTPADTSADQALLHLFRDALQALPDDVLTGEGR